MHFWDTVADHNLGNLLINYLQKQLVKKQYVEVVEKTTLAAVARERIEKGERYVQHIDNRQPTRILNNRACWVFI